MNFRIRYLSAILLMFVTAFSVSGQKNAMYEKYINTYSHIAIQQERQYKVPAYIKLAQAILETGGGQSYLAKEANNHFGIKCHTEWRGDRAYKNAEIPNECFRKYRTVADSYEDHSKFLTERPRYERLFKLKITDYKGWAKGLQECGYATDHGYANKLIRVIETYELYSYNADTKIEKKTDNNVAQQVPNTSNPRNIFKTHGLIYVVVRYDDSLTEIAKDLGFKAKDLAKYNEIPVNFPLQQGDIVYLEKKKKKADRPNNYHVVHVGESMHSISQQYGIQVKNLYKRNNKNMDYVPLEGEMLKLR